MADATPLTALTPVYLDRPERWDYLTTTLESFYRCNQYPGELVHNLVDDRSPIFQHQLVELCAAYKIRILRRVDPAHRTGFFEVFRSLIASVETEFFLYLEPDHYFYLPIDFFSPIGRMFDLVPELVAVYLRAPLTRERFQRVENRLLTFDRNWLHPLPIDAENTGWVGYGHQHEGFSLMPTVYRTAAMQAYLLRDGFWIDAKTPYELEMSIDADWNRTRLTGYLNAQAFCYHIGRIGGMGGGATHVNDTTYESIWSEKIR